MSVARTVEEDGMAEYTPEEMEKRLEAIRNPIPGQPCYRCEEMVNNEHHLCQDLAWGMAF